MKKPITVAEILLHVSAQTGLSIDDLKGPRRTKQIAPYRQMAYYLSSKMTAMSYPQIGRLIGGRDHSTIIHGCEQCEIRMERDPEYLAMVFSIRESLTSGIIRPKFRKPLPDILTTGDRIAHPRYGIGEVIGWVTQVIDGRKISLYTMRFDKDGITVRVPKHKVGAVGICKLPEPEPGFEMPPDPPKVPEALVSKLMRKPVEKVDDHELDDIEWLSRRVAAAYA